MTEEEANIPLQGSKFTKTQFLTYARLAQRYILDPEKEKGQEVDTQAKQLETLFNRPDAVKTEGQTLQVDANLQKLQDETNADIAAGQMTSRAHRQEVFEKLSNQRKAAQKRGQTAQRRSTG